MKITGLEVDGFGVWSGLKLDPLSEGLNVFFGPNEAGKTTLMQFVRSVLYGFFWVVGTGMPCFLANAINTVRELRSHSRQGAMIFIWGSNAR